MAYKTSTEINRQESPAVYLFDFLEYIGSIFADQQELYIRRLFLQPEL